VTAVASSGGSGSPTTASASLSSTTSGHRAGSACGAAAQRTISCSSAHRPIASRRSKDVDGGRCCSPGSSGRHGKLTDRMARQRRTGGGGCLGELVVVILLVSPIHLLQPVCGWSDAETGGLEVAACGLLAIAASIRGRGSERTAPEIPEAEAIRLRQLVAARVARNRSLQSGRRSTGSLPTPAWNERRYRAEGSGSSNREETPADRHTRRARDPIRAQMRFRVLQRDGFRCRYCGRSGSAPGVVLHVDHVVPLAAGGTSTEDNLLTACEECNLGKSTMALLQSERGVR
jgi:5-methylcytosine-specific restriction endonuclease McrA